MRNESACSCIPTAFLSRTRCRSFTAAIPSTTKKGQGEDDRPTPNPTVAVPDLDQARFTLNPTRTRVSTPVRLPCKLQTPGDNRKQVMFGTANSRTGQTHLSLTAHKRNSDSQHLVDRHLIPACPEADPVSLSIDGASIKPKSTHASTDRQQVVSASSPSYAPKLNLQKHPWRWFPPQVMHDHFFPR